MCRTKAWYADALALRPDSRRRSLNYRDVYVDMNADSEVDHVYCILAICLLGLWPSLHGSYYYTGCLLFQVSSNCFRVAVNMREDNRNSGWSGNYTFAYTLESVMVNVIIDVKRRERGQGLVVLMSGWERCAWKACHEMCSTLYNLQRYYFKLRTSTHRIHLWLYHPHSSKRIRSISKETKPMDECAFICL